MSTSRRSRSAARSLAHLAGIFLLGEIEFYEKDVFLFSVFFYRMAWQFAFVVCAGQGTVTGPAAGKRPRFATGKRLRLKNTHNISTDDLLRKMGDSLLDGHQNID